MRELFVSKTSKGRDFADKVNQVITNLRLTYLYISCLLLFDISQLNTIKYQEPWIIAGDLILPYLKHLSPGITLWKNMTGWLDEGVKEIREKGCKSIPRDRLAVLIGWLIFRNWIRECGVPEFNVHSHIEEYIETVKEFLPDTILGDLLALPAKDLPEDARLEAARRLYTRDFSRPIYRQRWNDLEQDIKQELTQRPQISGLSALDLSILGNIFSLPKAIYRKERKHSWEEWREIELGELPPNELLINPKIMKKAIANLMTNDLAGPGWRNKHLQEEYIEEGESQGN